MKIWNFFSGEFTDMEVSDDFIALQLRDLEDE